MCKKWIVLIAMSMGLAAAGVQAGVNSGAANGVSSGARVKMPEKQAPAEEKDKKNAEEPAPQQPKQQ